MTGDNKVKAIIFDDGSNASKVLIDELSKDEEYNVLIQKVGEFKSLGEWMKTIKEQGTADSPLKVFLHFPYEDYSVFDKKNTKKDLLTQVSVQEERHDNLKIIKYYENRGNDNIEEAYKHLVVESKITKEKDIPTPTPTPKDKEKEE